MPFIKINSANKVIIAFLLIEYLFPYFFHFYVQEPSYMYFESENFSFLFFCMILAAISPLFLCNRKIVIDQSHLEIRKNYLVFFIVSLCCVIFTYYSLGLAGSRYFGKMSELPSFNLQKAVAQILFEIFCYCNMLLIWALLLAKSRLVKLQNILAFLTISTINGINSAVSLIYPILKSLFSQRTIKIKFNKTFKNIVLVLLSILLFSALFVFGLFIKSGQDGLPSFKNYFSKEYLVDRFSTHLYHFSSVIWLRASEQNQEIEEIHQVYLLSIIDRYKLLMYNHRSFNDDRDKSIAGYFNYHFWNEALGPPGRGGSSIGLFATLFLIFPLKISFFATFFFFLAIKKCLVKVFYKYPHCSWLMAFAFAYGPLRIFTDDPLICLNPFEPVIFSIFLFLFISKKKVSLF